MTPHYNCFIFSNKTVDLSFEQIWKRQKRAIIQMEVLCRSRVYGYKLLKKMLLSRRPRCIKVTHYWWRFWWGWTQAITICGWWRVLICFCLKDLVKPMYLRSKGQIDRCCLFTILFWRGGGCFSTIALWEKTPHSRRLGIFVLQYW